jgi:hypothetical protein
MACARAPVGCGRFGQEPALGVPALRDGRDALCPWTGHAAIRPSELAVTLLGMDRAPITQGLTPAMADTSEISRA